MVVREEAIVSCLVGCLVEHLQVLQSCWRAVMFAITFALAFLSLSYRAVRGGRVIN